MKTRLLILLACALPSLLAADPAAPAKIFLDRDETGTDTVTFTEWYITSDHLGKLPAYKPADDEPPLTIKAALAVAQAELKKHLTPQMTWSLDSVELQQIDAGNSGETAPESYTDKPTGKWFYKVVFTTQRPDPKTSIWTEPYPVYVLMDGTVATRRERPPTQEEIQSQDTFAQTITNAVHDADKKAADKNAKEARKGRGMEVRETGVSRGSGNVPKWSLGTREGASLPARYARPGNK